MAEKKDHLLAYFVNGTYLPTTPASTDAEIHNGRLAIIFIAVICLAGAIVESAVKHTRMMYTVMMFVFGCSAALLASTSPSFRPYLTTFEYEPHTTLNLFFPILIFEAAFSTDSHVFTTSLGQLLVLAIPGFATAALMSAIVARYVLPYGWDWNVAMAFGAVLSCTDATALMPKLKEIGFDQKSTVLLKGESLLNDGSTMVVFSVFLELARGSFISHGGAILLFIEVTLGGIAIGVAFGKFCTYWMGLIYNNFILEIIITITFPYIAFYVAETILGVSGVLAVMGLGLFMSSRRTCITPDVDKYLRRTWKILAFIAHTLIYFLVGIEVLQGITAAGIHQDDHYGFDDIIYLVILYFAALGIRGMMLLVLSPALKKLGYGFGVSKGVVLLWGGLRGSIALTLAIFVAQDTVLDVHQVGHKFLFHIAGMVLLSLLINGSTMQSVLKIIGMTEVSEVKLMSMQAVVSKLGIVQANTINALKSDRFLADTNWDVVFKNSTVDSPYKKSIEHKCNSNRRDSQCPKCNQNVQVDLSPQEMADLEREIRIRYLNTEKISYWRQYEQGMISADAVLRLVDITETQEDKPLGYVTVERVMPTWKMTGVYALLPAVSRFLEKGKRSFASRSTPPESPEGIRRQLYDVSVSPVMSWVMCIVTLGHLSLTVTDAILYTSQGVDLAMEFDILSWFAALAFLVEVLVKVIGLGCRGYFRRHTNVVAFIVTIIVGPVDVSAHVATGTYSWIKNERPNYDRTWSIALRSATAFRLAEVVLEVCLPYLLLFVHTAIEQKLNLGYDVGRGYVTGKEECHHFIDQMSDNHVIRDKLKNYSDKNKFSVIKELAIIQRENPGVAGAIKVRQATRAVLNRMKEELQKYKEDGLIEESEAEKLNKIFDQRIKMLLNSPPTMPPMPPMQALKFVPWLQNVEELGVDDFVRQRVQVLNYDHGDIIMNSNEPAHGIYIVVSGLIKVVGKSKAKSAMVNKEKGDGDDTGGDLAEQATDYVTAGAILGELEVLSGHPMSTTVQAETAAKLYAFGRRDLDVALTIFPSMKKKLWRSVAISLVSTLADELRLFQMFSAEMKKIEIEKGYLLDLDGVSSYSLESTIAHAFLINGRITVVYADGGCTVIDRPCRIPSDNIAIRFLSGSETVIYCLPAEETALISQTDRNRKIVTPAASRMALPKRLSRASRISTAAKGADGRDYISNKGDLILNVPTRRPTRLKSLPTFLRNPFTGEAGRRTQSEQALPSKVISFGKLSSTRLATTNSGRGAGRLAAANNSLRSFGKDLKAVPSSPERLSRTDTIKRSQAHSPPNQRSVTESSAGKFVAQLVSEVLRNSKEITFSSLREDDSEAEAPAMPEYAADDSHEGPPASVGGDSDTADDL